MIGQLSDEYLAGIIDGEGSIYFRKLRGGYTPRLCVVNTHRPLLDCIAAQYGGKVYQRTRHSNKRAKVCYVWEARDLAGLLFRIAPLLLVKSKQAYAALEYILTGPHPTSVSHSYRAFVSELNRRGTT